MAQASATARERINAAMRAARERTGDAFYAESARRCEEQRRRLGPRAVICSCHLTGVTEGEVVGKMTNLMDEFADQYRNFDVYVILVRESLLARVRARVTTIAQRSGAKAVAVYGVNGL